MSEPIKNFTIAAAKPAIENLDVEEAQLLARLREVQVRKAEQEKIRKEAEAEARRISDLTKPIRITVVGMFGGMVNINNEWRQDLLDLLQSVPGRAYRGAGENAIPTSEWFSVAEKMQALPNVTLKYREGVEHEIKFFLTAPAWLVELEKRALKVTPGPRYDAYVLYNKIPGLEWNKDKKIYTVPLTEAWRLFTLLEKVEGVVYTDEAKAYTFKQVEDRSRLDEIGLATDWDYPVELQGGVKLRPFQNVGCAFIEATGGRALLAYQMGLGKTIIALAYAIKNDLRTVVVCPASLKNNWAREIYRLTGQKPNVFMGGEPTNHDIVQMLTSPSKFNIINYDILGRKTEYDEVTEDTEGYKHHKHIARYMWVDAINLSKPDLIIGDESHYIKNTDSNRSQAVRQLQSPRVIHMTGTPVLNRPGELWPILTMLSPDTFPSEDTFKNQYTFDGKSARNVGELREALKPIMIRRKQSDVVADMPPLNRVNDYMELSPKARKLYTKVMNGVYEAISAYSSSGHGGGESNITSILARIQRLKMVCAIDKVDSTAELALNLADSRSEDAHPKILIFSQYKAVAYAISQRLGNEALCFVSRGRHDFVTADDNARDALVQQFQTDPSIKFLVVTEKTAKEGHNITAAGVVIFNDLFWTPAAHEQGEGRAYMRINDPHGIDAYYRIIDMAGDSIEEWIWEMLKSKMEVINQTVEGVEGTRDTSIAMELINKIKGAMWSRK